MAAYQMEFFSKRRLHNTLQPNILPFEGVSDQGYAGIVEEPSEAMCGTFPRSLLYL